MGPPPVGPFSRPPAGAPAGWYPDPLGYPWARFYDGRRWTPSTHPYHFRGERPAHPVLDVRAALGAAAVLLVSLVASRFLLEAIIGFEWPIAVYAVIVTVLGYGPSLAWCRHVSQRWGTGRVANDLGLRFRSVDLGWGPLMWLTAVAMEIAVYGLIQILDVPVTGNTEGIRDLSIDRTYVVTLLVTAVVAAPVVEELVFRGVILRGLRSRMAAPYAVTVQALVFGVAHIDPARGWGNVGLAMILSAVGAALGGGAYLLRRIGPAVIAHAILNAVVMTIVLAR